MVKKTLLVLTIIGIISLSFLPNVFAQRQYYFGQEWCKIWINQDGSIDLFYNVSITLEAGQQISWISIGQPKRDFTIGPANDQYGNILQTSDISSGEDYKVRVNLNTPLQSGQTIWFTLLTNVAKIVYDDETNPGNDGMEFILSWFSEASIKDARILIVLPPGVPENEVKTGSEFYDNLQYEEDRFAVYWQKQNLSPDDRFNVGVSYPKQEGWTSHTKGPDFLNAILENLGLVLFFGFIGIILLLSIIFRKRSYIKPSMGV